MAKFAEADARLFRNKFVCRKCRQVVRAPPLKIADMEVRCRTCMSKAFKPKRKK